VASLDQVISPLDQVKVPPQKAWWPIDTGRDDSDFDPSKCFGQSPRMQQGNLIEMHEQAGDFGNGKKRRAIRG